MIGPGEQLELFGLIGRTLKKKVECYAIGGTALMFFGMKNATKDIDLVFDEESRRKLLAGALKQLGFGKPRTGTEIYRHSKAIREPPVLLERQDTRFDLFLRDIVSFILSPGIKKGVKERHRFGNLVINVVSPEHIFLLKSATDRKGDLDDARTIAESHNIDWGVVMDEAEWQTEHGRKVFVVYLYDFLEDLKEAGGEVPGDFLKKVRKIAEKEVEKALQEKESFRKYARTKSGNRKS